LKKKPRNVDEAPTIRTTVHLYTCIVIQVYCKLSAAHFDQWETSHVHVQGKVQEVNYKRIVSCKLKFKFLEIFLSVLGKRKSYFWTLTLMHLGKVWIGHKLSRQMPLVNWQRLQETDYYLSTCCEFCFRFGFRFWSLFSFSFWFR
jgi:hypothetical protein